MSERGKNTARDPYLLAVMSFPVPRPKPEELFARLLWLPSLRRTLRGAWHTVQESRGLIARSSNVILRYLSVYVHENTTAIVSAHLVTCRGRLCVRLQYRSGVSLYSDNAGMSIVFVVTPSHSCMCSQCPRRGSASTRNTRTFTQFVVEGSPFLSKVNLASDHIT